jgi:hypothetical protein
MLRKRLIKPRPAGKLGQFTPLDKAEQAAAQAKAAAATAARSTKKAAGAVLGVVGTLWYLAESLLYLVAIAATIVFAVYGVCWLAVQSGTASPVPGEVVGKINEFLTIFSKLK